MQLFLKIQQGRNLRAADILVTADVAGRIWDAVERACAEQALRIENDKHKRAEAALCSPTVASTSF